MSEFNFDNVSAEELAEKIKLAETQVLILRARQFSEDGFGAFFELVHGSPLHREGRMWVANIFRAYRSGVRKVLEECFRGSGKSTVVTELFMSYWIGLFPHTTNVIIRVNGQKANESTAKVADRIANDYMFKRVFPHVVPVDGRWGEKSGYMVKRTDISEAEWADTFRETTRPNGATLIGYGYDSGSIQGTRANGLLIVDDIHAKENTRSARQLADVKEFVQFQLDPIPVPGQGLEIWNFTPWTDNDAYAERKKTGLYIHSKSPVMVECQPNDPDGILWPEVIPWPKAILDSVERGEIELNLEQTFPMTNRWWKLNWPERWGIVEIALQYIKMGQLSFAREYLLDLDATKGRVLKREWLHYMSHKEIDPTWPVVVGVDYASVSDKLKHKERDYAAFAIGRAIPWGGVVLTGGYFGHFTKPESLKLLQRIKEGHPTLQTIKVEAIGKGEEFYNDAQLLKDATGVPLPLSAIESHGKASKGERFEDYLGPRFEMSRAWVSDEYNEFLEEFEKEWLSFPNDRYDDVLDAVYMMLVAGEGFMPSRVERSFNTQKQKPHPYKNIGRKHVGQSATI